MNAAMSTPRLDTIVPAFAPAAQLTVLHGGRPIVRAVAGDESDAKSKPITDGTLFDLASVTKIVTAVAVMRLVERQRIHLDATVRRVLPAFGGQSCDAALVTWRHLLTHTSGLPATPRVELDADPTTVRVSILSTAPDGAPGRLLYSDVGFMVLGFAIEAITGRTLDRALDELVFGPAGLAMRYLPSSSSPIAPTEVCAWRRRRLRGEVHDEHAGALGGVAGHAGLFGTADSVAGLGQLLLHGGRPVLQPSSVNEMVREQSADGAMRRGYGLSLWSPDPEASSHPFSVRAFGHTGFTGTSLWVDPEREMVVALLTNTVYRGRVDNGFAHARVELHQRIVEEIDATVGKRRRDQ